MADPEFTPGTRVHWAKAREGMEEWLYVGPSPKPSAGVGTLVVIWRSDDDYWEAYEDDLTPVPDTVEITVSLTRKQVRETVGKAYWVTPWGRALRDACQSWLASEEATK